MNRSTMRFPTPTRFPARHHRELSGTELDAVVGSGAATQPAAAGKVRVHDLTVTKTTDVPST